MTVGPTSPKSFNSNQINHLIKKEGESSENIRIPFIPINGKNLEVLNYNEQRISNILKQAVRIEDDQKEKFDKFSHQKIENIDHDIKHSQKHVREKIVNMKEKLNTINKMKQITEAKMC